MIVGYEVAVSSLAPAGTSAYVNFWAVTRPAVIREIHVFNSSASTALPLLQIVRSTARGTQTATVTPTTAADAQNLPSIALSPTSVVDTAWSVQPTLAAIPMRMTDIAGTVGSGLIWNWQSDGELVVLPANGIAIQNGSGGATAVIRVTIVWGE